jgi:hypothetical protein
MKVAWMAQKTSLAATGDSMTSIVARTSASGSGGTSQYRWNDDAPLPDGGRPVVL